MNTIPIFYACDDNFVKYTIVSLQSMIRNASTDHRYHVYVLHTNIAPETQNQLFQLKNDNFDISFENVTAYLDSISHRLPIRDYYSKTTYFRLFIADMFPQYDKAIYIDSDTVVQGDISRMYLTDIGDAYVGACHEQAMVQVDEYGTYAEKVVGIDRNFFFNAGVLLINCRQFRAHKVLEQFTWLLGEYNFVVTQDEDYLNLICKDRVYWLDQRWNTEVFGSIPYPIEEACILHYIMTNKPWHYADCLHGDIFWKYAAQTSVYGDILAELEQYTDQQRQRDRISCDNLLKLAVTETNREDNYQNRLNKTLRAADRVMILERIAQKEAQGLFDEDVEDDPPSPVLKPEDIDYLRKGLIGNCKRRIAFAAAYRFFGKLERNRDIVVNRAEGLEHLAGVKGAVITCNHFHPMDSFIMQRVFDDSGHPKRLYRVIREGNYTNFPGFYGFLMRNCNTLPLSSNMQTMKKFLTAVKQVLAEGNCLLIYPEQSMWWNYRKPKPLKTGAFDMAVKNNVPVVPCFITMRDTDKLGADGFPVQEYTPHLGEPIWPDNSLPKSAAKEKLKQQNEAFCNAVYEKEYGALPSYRRIG
jgi:lipopolysaccharide biosynthesis glycosyltransferase